MQNMHVQAEMLDPAILGTLNVLRSCVKAASVKRLVLTSSSAAVRFRDDLEQPGAKTHLDESSWSSIPFCNKYQVMHTPKTLTVKQVIHCQIHP